MAEQVRDGRVFLGAEYGVNKVLVVGHEYGARYVAGSTLSVTRESRDGALTVASLDNPPTFKPEPFNKFQFAVVYYGDGKPHDLLFGNE